MSKEQLPIIARGREKIARFVFNNISDDPFAATHLTSEQEQKEIHDEFRRQVFDFGPEGVYSMDKIEQYQKETGQALSVKLLTDIVRTKLGV